MKVRLLPPGLYQTLDFRRQASGEYNWIVTKETGGTVSKAQSPKPKASHGGRPVLVQELGCEPSLCRFNSDRPPSLWKTSGWMRELS